MKKAIVIVAVSVCLTPAMANPEAMPSPAASPAPSSGPGEIPFFVTALGPGDYKFQATANGPYLPVFPVKQPFDMDNEMNKAIAAQKKKEAEDQKEYDDNALFYTLAALKIYADADARLKAKYGPKPAASAPPPSPPPPEPPPPSNHGPVISTFPNPNNPDDQMKVYQDGTVEHNIGGKRTIDPVPAFSNQ